MTFRILQWVLACVIFAGQPEPGPYGVLPQRSTPTGPPVAGLALSISSAPMAPHLASHVYVVIEIRNGRAVPVSLGVPQVPMEYEFRVYDARTGHRLAERNPWRSGTDVYAGGMYVEAGRSWIMTVPIDDYVELNAVGLYRVSVATRNVRDTDTNVDVGLTSNSIFIDVPK